VRLPVSAPFHCSLMRPAQERLEKDLVATVLEDPSPALVNNVDARVVATGTECRDGLVRQVSAPVRWQECVERLVSEGVDTFVEVGPGRVLGGLVKRISKTAAAFSVEDPGSLEQTLAALTAGAA
jgi:[acyl-carrier-protein] S-malonyltransferase